MHTWKVIVECCGFSSVVLRVPTEAMTREEIGAAARMTAVALAKSTKREVRAEIWLGGLKVREILARVGEDVGY
jgi:hypothetical protein